MANAKDLFKKMGGGGLSKPGQGKIVPGQPGAPAHGAATGKPSQSTNQKAHSKGAGGPTLTNVRPKV